MVVSITHTIRRNGISDTIRRDGVSDAITISRNGISGTIATTAGPEVSYLAMMRTPREAVKGTRETPAAGFVLYPRRCPSREDRSLAHL